MLAEPFQVRQLEGSYRQGTCLTTTFRILQNPSTVSQFSYAILLTKTSHAEERLGS